MKALVLAVCMFSCELVRADLIITLNYADDPLYSASFNSAKTTWETLLVNYQDGKVVFATAGGRYSAGQTVSEVVINVRLVPIDGAGGVLGQGGFDKIARDTSGFFLATDGTLSIDVDDVAALYSSGALVDVVKHEIAHVLGFGGLWGFNGVYAANSGEFTGTFATAAWQSEFGQTGNPDVELEGGTGSANAHWNENLNGIGNTGIIDTFGRDMRHELMTGWLSSSPFISDMTVASFRDIGFTTSAVPEPHSLLGWSMLGIGLSQRRTRRPSWGHTA